MTASSPVEARELPVFKGIIATSKLPLAIWLAVLTMHEDIVGVLALLGERLPRHALGIVRNAENEANGIDVDRADGNQPSTDRANQVHHLREIFIEYPQAMDFVVDSLGSVLLQTNSEQLSHADREQLGSELNHFAERHGLQAQSSSLNDRVTRFHYELHRLIDEEEFTGSLGASTFWSITTRPEVLGYFGVEAKADTITAIIQPLMLVVRRGLIIDPYHEKAGELIEALQD